MIDTEFTKAREKIVNAYSQLDELEHAIIQFLHSHKSFYYGQRTLSNILNKIERGVGIHLPDGISRNKVKQTILQLEKKGLLNLVGTEYYLPQLIKEWILLDEYAYGDPSDMMSYFFDDRSQTYDSERIAQYIPDSRSAATYFRKLTYMGAIDEAAALFQRLTKKQKLRSALSQIQIVECLVNKFDENLYKFFFNLHPPIIVAAMMGHEAYYDTNPEAWRFVEEIVNSGNDDTGAFRMLLGEMAILTNQREYAHAILDDVTDTMATGAKAALDMIEGNEVNLEHLFENGVAVARKFFRARNAILPGISGVYHSAWLLKQGDFAKIKQAQQCINSAFKEWTFFSPLYEALKYIPGTLGLNMESKGNAWNYLQLQESTDSATVVESQLYLLLMDIWREDYALGKDPDRIVKSLKLAIHFGYYHFTQEILEMALRTLGNDHKDLQPFLPHRRGEKNTFFLMGTLIQKKPWERALEKLHLFVSADTDSRAQENKERLVWLLDKGEMNPDGSIELEVMPFKQRRAKRGGWNKPTRISTTTLAERTETLSYLTELDKRIIRRALTTEYSWSYSYGVDETIALEELIGHPCVFWIDDLTAPVQIVKKEPVLSVKQSKGNTVVSIVPNRSYHGEFFAIFEEGPHSIAIYEYSKELERLESILDEFTEFPPEAKDTLEKALEKLSRKISIQSDAEKVFGGETIEGIFLPHVRFIPNEDCYDVGVHVCPGKAVQNDVTFSPGQGPVSFTVHKKSDESSGKQTSSQVVVVNRNLQAEKALAAPIIDIIKEVGSDELDTFLYSLDGEDAALELLLRLDEMGDEAVAIEWPEKKRPKLFRGDVQNLSLRVDKDNEWFSVSGDLNIDEDLTIAFQKLLELVDKSDGRFIRLDKNRLMSITSGLRKRIDHFAAMTIKKGDTLNLAPTAPILADSLFKNIGQFDAHRSWKSKVKKIKTVMESTFAVPGGLQAQLRDYQNEGYQWLVKLSEAGFGACLADDMGLGKTVQSLALLLHRAPQGPALVISPTSVCGVWEQEILKFAPALRTFRLHDTDRDHVVEKAAQYDIVICSYGLLVSEKELLSKKSWTTIILDEAQAVKNAAAKRTKIAQNLSGTFKMVTTGTPIENHLGELWSIMTFCNPGLLGSIKNFQDKYQREIEVGKNTKAREKLKKIVSPFILRRLKSQVIEELPPKTEIVIDIELSKKERSFYEAIRAKAVKNIETIDGPAGTKRFKILAELMQLRRACCYPGLVKGAPQLDSTKLAVFEDKIMELVDNGHKALVFSQFVDYLAILKKKLQQMHIGFQYLDGSTPLKKREKAVEAFRTDDSSVFLISLKAGGFGLNLTVADYVFIMDPWWNPAVEDQAADRVHRIGQKRPVTVYRFVSEGTIEEKIIQLHKDKRSLAESILDGGDAPAKVDIEELVKLIL